MTESVCIKFINPDFSLDCRPPEMDGLIERIRRIVPMIGDEIELCMNHDRLYGAGIAKVKHRKFSLNGLIELSVEVTFFRQVGSYV